MKKNKLYIFIVLMIVFVISIGLYFFVNKNNLKAEKNYTASKSSSNRIYTNNYNNEFNIDLNNNKIEEDIVSFSTKIYDTSSNRQNNISISCNTLNNTIVKKDSTFSFCNTVGKATTEKGYKEADIFDKYGNVKKGLGGGNCQISTTLYNAVLQISSLTILERHEHSNKVPYIEVGKDAAVAYGSYDFKFKNNSGFDIKIKAINSNDTITITLSKIQK